MIELDYGSIRREFESRLSDESWDRLSERELLTMIALVQGRARTAALVAIDELVLETSQNREKAT